MDFYLNNKKKYEKLYWNNYGNNINKANGFDDFPDNLYEIFLEFTNVVPKQEIKILDLGCGTGLLLRYLKDKSQKKIIAHGVDFLEKSIKKAIVTFKEYENNFECENIIKYSFDKAPFDIVIFNPLYLIREDRKLFLNKIIKSICEGGLLIVYSYRDELSAYTYDNLTFIINEIDDTFSFDEFAYDDINLLGIFK